MQHPTIGVRGVYTTLHAMCEPNSFPTQQNLESYDIIDLSVPLSPLLILSDQVGYISSRLNDSFDNPSILVVTGGEVL